METFSALLAICVGNSPVPGEFPAQRPVTRNFDVFFDLQPNKRLSKQWWGWWFETLSCPLWRPCTVMRMTIPAGWCLLLFGSYLAQPLGKTMLTITVYVWLSQATVLGWSWGESSKQVFGEEPSSIHIRVFFREEILSWYCLPIIRLHHS